MGKQKKGFYLYEKKRLLQVCSKAGKRAHELGVAHRFTKEEARAAGMKGLQIRWGKNVPTKEQVDYGEEAGI